MVQYAYKDIYAGTYYKEIWILLPKTVMIVDGQSVSLPVGYRVRIFNISISSAKATVYVTAPDLNPFFINDAQYNNIILDSNRNWNRQCELSGPQTSDEYIWTGEQWISFRDTQ